MRKCCARMLICSQEKGDGKVWPCEHALQMCWYAQRGERMMNVRRVVWIAVPATRGKEFFHPTLRPEFFCVERQCSMQEHLFKSKSGIAFNRVTGMHFDLMADCFSFLCGTVHRKRYVCVQWLDRGMNAQGQDLCGLRREQDEVSLH